MQFMLEEALDCIIMEWCTLFRETELIGQKRLDATDADGAKGGATL